jgi:hypothetical protein
MVVLVPSNDLNPEPELYYGEDDSYVKSRGKGISTRKKPECPIRSYEEVNLLIAQ